MKKKDIFLIISVVLTIFVSLLVFFFDFYNYHFEFKEDLRKNSYVVLKNGRYFEFLCGNDVLGNGVDFTLKPFNEYSVENSGNMFKKTVVCNEDDLDIEKRVVFERTPSRIKVKQFIDGDFGKVGKNSFYYTHIEYPLVSEVKETSEYIEMYDLNCTTKIYKKNLYKYEVIDNFVRVGVEYSDNMSIIFEMEIECL